MVPSGDELLQRADMLAKHGRSVEAITLLEQQLVLGNARAGAVLAAWYLAGKLVKRDLGRCREVLGRACALGAHELEPAYIALLANGAGGSGRRWQDALERLAERGKSGAGARVERTLLGKMAIDQCGDPVSQLESNQLYSMPTIEEFPAFMTEEECRYLCEVVQPILTPATVGDPRTGKNVLDPVRKARTAAFPFIAESPFIHAINRRIASATRTTYEQGEPLQVISYGVGDEFKLHSDAIANCGNQRKLTFLVWLKADFTGGETEFPRLGLSLRGKPGDGIAFTNTDASGQPDPMAWHAGLPVTGGHKLMLSKWIRTHPIDLD
ncbi:MAG: 2OG-Fe(II) oxygenase [Sphingomonadaceae bacterium]